MTLKSKETFLSRRKNLPSKEKSLRENILIEEICHFSFQSLICFFQHNDRNILILGLDLSDCHRSSFVHDDTITTIAFVSLTPLLFSAIPEKKFLQIETLQIEKRRWREIRFRSSPLDWFDHLFESFTKGSIPSSFFVIFTSIHRRRQWRGRWTAHRWTSVDRGCSHGDKRSPEKKESNIREKHRRSVVCHQIEREKEKSGKNEVERDLIGRVEMFTSIQLESQRREKWWDWKVLIDRSAEANEWSFENSFHFHLDWSTDLIMKSKGVWREILSVFHVWSTNKAFRWK